MRNPPDWIPRYIKIYIFNVDRYDTKIWNREKGEEREVRERCRERKGRRREREEKRHNGGGESERNSDKRSTLPNILSAKNPNS